MGAQFENKIPSGYFVAMTGNDDYPLFQDASKSLGKYIGYLNQAIDSQKKKNICCRWEKISRDGLKISAKNHLYEVQPFTLIQLTLPDQEWAILSIIPEELDELKESGIDEEDLTIAWGKGKKNRKTHTFLAEQIRKMDDVTYHFLFDTILPDEEIVWQGFHFTWKRCRTSVDTDNLIARYENKRVKIDKLDDNGTFRLWADINNNGKIQVNGADTEYEILSKFEVDTFQKKYNPLKSHSQTWLIAGNKPEFKNCQVQDITENRLLHLRLEDIRLNGDKLNNNDWVYNSDDKILSPSNVFHQKKITITFAPYKDWLLSGDVVSSPQKWIQLVEDIDNQDGDTPEQSILEYFFDENVDIFPTEKRYESEKYHISGRKPDEYQLRLQNPASRKDEYPSGEYLYLRANIRELANQQEALRKLEQSPFPENLPLLNLMRNRDKQNWPEFIPLIHPLYPWMVLTDETFDGCDKQRSFVLTALATPDFAILDGPPGTGKTTTIRELILQLIRKGKRVLLAASTNAAINNVLERLRDEDANKAPVHATRLGQVDRARNVEEYALDNQCEKWTTELGLNEDSAKQLLIESANLVCGTTSGIHKLFNRDSRKSNQDPSENLTRGGAPFDVMIIDECSKTTFQEFVVPARLAKKWILVGDVKQLSPFTDRGQITSNLEHLENKNCQIADAALQKACNLLFQVSPYKNRLIIPVNSAVMKNLLEERRIRISGEHPDRELDKNILMISTQEMTLDNIESFYRYNVIFLTNDLLRKYRNQMPCDAIILEKDWMQSSHAFTHHTREDWRNNHSFKYKGGTETSAEEVHKILLSQINKAWSEEICWRLERIHWLRYSRRSGTRDYYEKDIDRLMPQSKDIKSLVFWVKSIAFPSILESLSTDGQHTYGVFTTLSNGFTPQELGCRLVTLTHQHRMHPELSEPPRKLFYTNNNSGSRFERSLLDGSKVKGRTWTYTTDAKYPSRRIWIDCDGTVGNHNSNEKEAEIVLLEIKKFGIWAEQSWNEKNKPEIAVLTFYKGQEETLRRKLKTLPGQEENYSHFTYKNCEIRLATVDYFQGQEADIVFLSMVNTYRDGFLDSPNRLNVAITRARHQMIIVGKYAYYHDTSKTEELNILAEMYDRIQSDRK